MLRCIAEIGKAGVSGRVCDEDGGGDEEEERRRGGYGGG
jgi:hypothetical protein